MILITLPYLAEANPGINQAIKYVGQDIDQYKKTGGNEHRTHHHGEVQFLQGIHGNLTDSLPSENVLDKKCAGQ